MARLESNAFPLGSRPCVFRGERPQAPGPEPPESEAWAEGGVGVKRRHRLPQDVQRPVGVRVQPRQIQQLAVRPEARQDVLDEEHASIPEVLRRQSHGQERLRQRPRLDPDVDGSAGLAFHAPILSKTGPKLKPASRCAHQKSPSYLFTFPKRPAPCQNKQSLLLFPPNFVAQIDIWGSICHVRCR